MLLNPYTGEEIRFGSNQYNEDVIGRYLQDGFIEVSGGEYIFAFDPDKSLTEYVTDNAKKMFSASRND